MIHIYGSFYNLYINIFFHDSWSTASALLWNCPWMGQLYKYPEGKKFSFMPTQFQSCQVCKLETTEVSLMTTVTCPCICFITKPCGFYFLNVFLIFSSSLWSFCHLTSRYHSHSVQATLTNTNSSLDHFPYHCQTTTGGVLYEANSRQRSACTKLARDCSYGKWEKKA